jgi:dTDP-glucose 4,6-dehydratase
MRILVTGASGFIGSALVPELRARGHEVWEARRYSAGRFDFWDRPHQVLFDLRDACEVRSAVVKIKPDAIIHLGAMSAVSYSFEHPQEVADVNYMGTVRLADAAREVGAWFIFAATSECYGRGEYQYPVVEGVPLGGTSPYAAAKIAAVEYLRTMEATYHVPVTILFPFNTIGRALVPPKGNRHFVVERAITQALETGRIQLHDPRPKRDFMFRTDHVRGYMAVVDHPYEAKGGGINLCTGACWTIEQMAQEVGKAVAVLYGKVVTVEFATAPDRPLDIPVLHGSNRKARDLIGWTPLYDIRGGIDRAVKEWATVLGIPNATA